MRTPGSVVVERAMEANLPLLGKMLPQCSWCVQATVGCDLQVHTVLPQVVYGCRPVVYRALHNCAFAVESRSEPQTWSLGQCGVFPTTRPSHTAPPPLTTQKSFWVEYFLLQLGSELVSSTTTRTKRVHACVPKPLGHRAQQRLWQLNAAVTNTKTDGLSPGRLCKMVCLSKVGDQLASSAFW